MNNAAKLKALQKKSFLQKKIVDNLSSCLKSATDKEELSAIQSQLTASVKSAIKKVERTGSLSSSMNFDAEPNLIQDKFNHTFTLFSNPAIEKLEKKKAAVEHELWLKEKELRGLHQRYAIAEDLTKNKAIQGLVFNIIKKFKTLSKEKQIEFTTDKKKLSRVVENHIERLIDYHEKEKTWGIDFTKRENLLDDFSTGKDIVVLAANLSSKYVLTATRAAYKVTRIQLEICIRERDKLKQKLAEINRLLEIEYAKDTQQGGFYKGFGGGGFGGGGAGGRW